ncbi:outer membrane protein assembly factor BamE domain-containing protein [Rhodanobacter sp. BL-MT-08]
MQHALAKATWVVLGLAVSTGAVAQTIDASADQRIRDLEARVATLERLQGIKPGIAAAAAPGVAPAAMQAPAVAPVPPMPPIPSAPTAADWGSLHRGMTVSQVTALLGKPGDTRVLPGSSTWYYPDTHGRSVQFDRNGRVEQWSQP